MEQGHSFSNAKYFFLLRYFLLNGKVIMKMCYYRGCCFKCNSVIIYHIMHIALKTIYLTLFFYEYQWDNNDLICCYWQVFFVNIVILQWLFRYVSDLYFRPNKVRTWSGHNQSLSGFEKIRMVGKGDTFCYCYVLLVFLLICWIRCLS